MAQAVRSVVAFSPQDELAPLRNQAALIRSLLDEFERVLPVSGAISRTEASLLVREQLSEELARMGGRLLECAASLIDRGVH
jgi:hypothetical protein